VSKRKKVIVSVTTDLLTDQRVHKTCMSLLSNGYDPVLFGRKYSNNSNLEERDYPCKRVKLWFNNGFLFYANYNLYLLFYLLTSRVDILLSNDLDTLLANYIASKLKRLHLVYDSHEYFTEVPELVNRPRIQRFWKNLESAIIPKLKNCYTVTSKIAEVYRLKYKVDFKVLRNFPYLKEEVKAVVKRDAIIYQGALNVDLGIQHIINKNTYVENVELWIAGDGDIKDELDLQIKRLDLSGKVKFLGRLPIGELRVITKTAKIGVSLEKQEGLNYTYALPNKVFDYIHAKVPVLYADLQEVKKTINGFNVGEELISYDSKEMAEQLNKMLNSSQYDNWVKQCESAAKEFNWQTEEQVLLSIFETL